MPGGEVIGRAKIIIVADGSEFEADVRRVVRESAPSLEKSGRNASKSFNSGFDKENKKGLDDRLRSLENSLDRQARILRRGGDGIGRAFGRGARNNLLNFFGVFVSAAPRAAAAVADLGGHLAGMAAELVEIGKTKGVGAAIGHLLGASIPGIVGAVVALQILISTLGILGSAAVVTTGLILALAGSLAFALAGAVGVVAGALIPFAAALGVAVLAISGLNKKTKVFKDLKKEWKDLRKETAKALFGEKQEGLEVVHSLLKKIRPLILAVAGGVGDVLDKFGKAIKGKPFTDLMGRLAKILPGMIRQLGDIGGNLLLTLGNAFVAASPQIKEFLGWLEKVTAKWVKFSEIDKKTGKSKLGEWFKGAWESAKLVGSTILEIIGLIGDLFGLGKGTGDTIFTSIKNDVQKIRAWLADPKNSAAIQQWFADAETLYQKLRLIVIAIGRIIDDLDTPGNRKLLFDVMDAAITALGWIDKLIVKIGDLHTKLGEKYDNSSLPQLAEANKDDWETIKGYGERFLQWWIPFWDSISISPKEAVAAMEQIKFGHFYDMVLQGLETLLKGWIKLWDRFILSPQEALDLVIRGFNLFIEDLMNAPARVKAGLDLIIRKFEEWVDQLVGHSIIPDLIDEIVRLFATLPGRIIGALGDLGALFATWLSTLPGKAKTAATNIVKEFSGLAGRMITKAGDLTGKFGTWASKVPGKAKALAGDIVGAFSGVARKSMEKAGSIASAVGTWGAGAGRKAAGVASDIVSAFRGVGADIAKAMGPVKITATVVLPKNLPTVTIKADVVTASGGVFDGAQWRVIGEAGPEAVVPLNRPLNRVDPAVRALSAFAQGLTPPGGSSGGGGGGKHIEVGGITINTPTENPRAVAAEVIARMTVSAYF